MLITTDDIFDLIVCGRAARGWAWRRLFYALKDAILERYGALDGYDLQVWWDYEFGYGAPEQEVHAEHKHILARWRLAEHVFHRPTAEFYYFNFAFQHERVSPGYGALVSQCHGIIEGRKPFDVGAQSAAWPALKRLVGRFGPLIRARQQMALEIDA